MTVPYMVKVFEGVTADADGDVDITVNGGYHGEDIDRTFTVDELRKIAIHAQAHQVAYEEFKERDYEGEELYFKVMEQFEDVL